jgi:hypothetical protein
MLIWSQHLLANHFKALFLVCTSAASRNEGHMNATFLHAVVCIYTPSQLGDNNGAQGFSRTNGNFWTHAEMKCICSHVPQAVESSIKDACHPREAVVL